jgi:hypothetical protein
VGTTGWMEGESGKKERGERENQVTDGNLCSDYVVLRYTLYTVYSKFYMLTKRKTTHI